MGAAWTTFVEGVWPMTTLRALMQPHRIVLMALFVNPGDKMVTETVG